MLLMLPESAFWSRKDTPSRWISSVRRSHHIIRPSLPFPNKNFNEKFSQLLKIVHSSQLGAKEKGPKDLCRIAEKS